MKLVPTEPFGVSVEGIDLSVDLTSSFAEQLKRLLADHGVVALPHQHHLDDRGFVVFLKCLGQLTFTEGEAPVPGAPDLNVVTNVGRSRRPRSVFHTDTSYVKHTPAYTALRIVTVPEAGGDTLFTDQYKAWSTLPSRLQAQLADLKALHRVTGLKAYDLKEIETWHSLVRLHPLSGQPLLFLSTPERCVALSGYPHERGHRILKALYKHSIRENRILRHRWQAGDVVIWDNRCTMHRADHSNVVGDRTLHRGMVLAT